jgi:hypothetical protein
LGDGGGGLGAVYKGTLPGLTSAVHSLIDRGVLPDRTLFV